MLSHPWAERLGLAAMLLGTFAARAWRADQPILENYVGRQVPTAMVAGNLARGSGFLAPQLDTGPFPNLFLVEPPVSAQLVAWTSGATGLPLDPTGRLLSAAATTLAAWSLHALARRRGGPTVGFATLVAFATFPVTLRYGRAFQPDPTAMALVLAGLAALDRGSRTAWVLGWTLLGLGIAQKVTWAFALVPALFALGGKSTVSRRVAPAVLAMIPALAWYLLVSLALVDGPSGSATSADNAANWLARLAPTSFLDARRFAIVGRDLFVRSFTPLGSLLFAFGIARSRGADPLWRWWTIAAGLALVVLFGKLHHDYYWLMLAPPAAGWVGIAAGRLAERSRPLAAGVLAALAALGIFQSRSTWATPREWRDAPELARAIRKNVPVDALVIAPEAVIYLGGRRGCRLEYDGAGAVRAANEWRPTPPYVEADPSSLVRFYRTRAGARYYADVDLGPEDPTRRRLREAVLVEPSARVIEDRPGRYLIVAFDDPVVP